MGEPITDRYVENLMDCYAFIFLNNRVSSLNLKQQDLFHIPFPKIFVAPFSSMPLGVEFPFSSPRQSKWGLLAQEKAHVGLHICFFEPMEKAKSALMRTWSRFRILRLCS